MDISEGKEKSRGEDAKRQAKPKRVRNGIEQSFRSQEGTAQAGREVNYANWDHQCGDDDRKLRQNPPDCSSQQGGRNGKPDQKRHQKHG